MRHVPVLSVLTCLLFSLCASAQRASHPQHPISPSPAKQQGYGGFEHEIWAQTSDGGGYVYGPTNRRSGMSVVDIDVDGDSDLVFPSNISNPLIMRNFGSGTSFYPGGTIEMQVSGMPADYDFDLGTAFGDLTGDGLPDMAAVIVGEYKRIAWFRNEGPSDNPNFAYQGILFESAGHIASWVTLEDIDNDGLLEAFVADWLPNASTRPHRVYEIENTGSPTAPSFQPAVEVEELSMLMPDSLFKSAKENSGDHGQAGPEAHPRRIASVAGEKQGGGSYNLGDIGFADWNLDGLRDFLFYERERGLSWIPNVGTPTEAEWYFQAGEGWYDDSDPELANILYSHIEEDDATYVEGTFHIRENPERAKPEVEWLDEIYLSVDNRFKIERYFVAEEDYRTMRVMPVAFPIGQGQAAFWDYDLDGDPDLFRMGSPDISVQPVLITYPNVGTPYSPAWGEYFIPADRDASGGLALYRGRAEDYDRGELITIANHDNGTNGPDLFIQRLDGSVQLYWAFGALYDANPPNFDLANANLGAVVNPAHTNRSPRGLVLANFDYYEDFDEADGGFYEMLVCYGHDDGAELILVNFNGIENPGPGEVTRTNVSDTLLPHPDGDGFLDPLYIEALATADWDLDGVSDLIVATSNDLDYEECEIHYYRNILTDDAPYFRFEYIGRLDEPWEKDRYYGRMPSTVDLDADGDQDLFIGHHSAESHIQPYVNFYRNTGNTGLTYVRFRVVSGRSWPLHLDLTIGTSNFSVAPTYSTIFNGSGGTLYTDAFWEAGTTAPSVDILETTNLAEDYQFGGEARVIVDVVPTVSASESKAIIIVGDTLTGDLYPTFASIAGIAHNVLISEGLDPESIRLFAAGNIDADFDGENDTFAAPTLSSIQNTITSWGADTEKLLIYLVDHGQRERFRLNATEFLASDVLGGWLDQLNPIGTSGPQLSVLIDTCESGTFVDDLAGNNRIIMTSAGAGPIQGVSLFDKSELISFSLAFWVGIYNGQTYGQSFDEAKLAIEAINPLQVPKIDDTGNGIPNEAADGAYADEIRPGGDFEITPSGVFISDVAGDQIINSNSAPLHLSGVIAPFPVEYAWAIIVPPNFERPTLDNDDEQPVSDLPSVQLTESSTSPGRWEGNYTGFDQGGLYKVQYFVKIGGQAYASPRIGFVDRINIPDAWEANDTATAARWLPANSVQGHNFHDRDDEDWVRFSAPAGDSAEGRTATFAVISPGPNNRPIVELYRDRPDDTPLLIRTEESNDRGEDLVFDHVFSTDGQHLLRVYNGADEFGAGTSYLFLAAVGTGGGNIIATNLAVNVLDADSNTPIPGATIFLDNRNVGGTTNEGLTVVPVTNYGSYTVAADKKGFSRTEQVVTVDNIFEPVTVYMQANTTEGEGSVSGQVRNSETNLPVPGMTVSLTGSVNRSTTTNASGEFSFLTVPAGDYTLRVSGTGYNALQYNITVTADQVTIRDFLLIAATGTTSCAAGGSDSQAPNHGDLLCAAFLLALLFLGGNTLQRVKARPASHTK